MKQVSPVGAGRLQSSKRLGTQPQLSIMSSALSPPIFSSPAQISACSLLLNSPSSNCPTLHSFLSESLSGTQLTPLGLMRQHGFPEASQKPQSHRRQKWVSVPSASTLREQVVPSGQASHGLSEHLQSGRPETRYLPGPQSGHLGVFAVHIPPGRKVPVPLTSLVQGTTSQWLSIAHFSSAHLGSMHFSGHASGAGVGAHFAPGLTTPLTSRSHGMTWQCGRSLHFSSAQRGSMQRLGQAAGVGSSSDTHERPFFEWLPLLISHSMSLQPGFLRQILVVRGAGPQTEGQAGTSVAWTVDAKARK